ncbi:Ribosome assembly protein 1 [Porphyridium purpureum]|uniref:Ribosome assembly protein 1 n=1 Tax=Porphyridium purpureum TaxID=35688 RepID=A0A5J4YJA5_PORPP|nr:Ribosome assembly protein 1 [Porphyridium purpureum]|eukprot:POR3525..scf289_17
MEERAIDASRIRNICVIAHVDHGKTSLTDSLISANGLISARLAGQLRYLDSRADEQERGITMKTSSITLSHTHSLENERRAMVNLLDSPGHVDFSGEVDVALRMCDGALLVVDVVEGVRVQTAAVLRAALLRNVQPVLVLNKIDRLFTEMALDADAAYRHLVRVLEQVNVILGIRAAELMFENEPHNDQPGAEAIASLHDERQPLVFAPENGNVVFASAIDGWAFRIDQFARLCSARFGLSENTLQKTLWGDFYLDSKSKKIVRGNTSSTSAAKATASSSSPLFVQMIAKNLAKVYKTVLGESSNIEERQKMVAALGVNVSARDVKHRDARMALRAIMSAWLPLATAVLDCVLDVIPDPRTAQSTRMEAIWNHERPNPSNFDSDTAAAAAIRAYELQRDAIVACSAARSRPLIAYVGKMVYVEPERAISTVPERNPSPNANVGDTGAQSKQTSVLTKTIAVCRVFSGMLRVGDEVHVYGPRYNPPVLQSDGGRHEDVKENLAEETQIASDTKPASSPNQHHSVARVSALYLLMGKDMEIVQQAEAGSICGIEGLEDHVPKTASLSSLAPAGADGGFLPLTMMDASKRFGVSSASMMRVAIEPTRAPDLAALQEGLRRLNQADPVVETYVLPNGELVLCANGELHLERCLKDLRDTYAKDIPLHVSPPLLSFRETAAGATTETTLAASLPQLSPALFANTPIAERRTAILCACLGVDAKSQPYVLDRVGPKRYKVTLRAGRIPTNLAEFLEACASSQVYRERLHKLRQMKGTSKQQEKSQLPEWAQTFKRGFWTALEQDAHDAFEEQSTPSRDPDSENTHENILVSEIDPTDASMLLRMWKEHVVPSIWSFGPKKFGSNLLLGLPPGENDTAAFAGAAQEEAVIVARVLLDQYEECLASAQNVEEHETELGHSAEWRELAKGLISGFQVAAGAGPLCEEPMYGVAFIITGIELPVSSALSDSNVASAEVSAENGLKPLAISGTPHVLSVARDGFRQALLHAGTRLMEAMFQVDIDASMEALSGIYAVVGKRRGRIVREDMKGDGNASIFTIRALLPVTESFGFTDLLRKQTSGGASFPQISFSHWEALEQDPFWVPATDEELEDLGLEDSTVITNNLARKLVSRARRRKGLFVEEKIVDKAEKQRTIKKNK